MISKWAAVWAAVVMLIVGGAGGVICTAQWCATHEASATQQLRADLAHDTAVMASGAESLREPNRAVVDCGSGVWRHRHGQHAFLQVYQHQGAGFLIQLHRELRESGI